LTWMSCMASARNIHCTNAKTRRPSTNHSQRNLHKQRKQLQLRPRKTSSHYGAFFKGKQHEVISLKNVCFRDWCESLMLRRLGWLMPTLVTWLCVAMCACASVCFKESSGAFLY
jgi:hypothetical protein